MQDAALIFYFMLVPIPTWIFNIMMTELKLPCGAGNDPWNTWKRELVKSHMLSHILEYNYKQIKKSIDKQGKFSEQEENEYPMAAVNTLLHFQNKL